MTREQARLNREARATYRRVLQTPDDPNAQIIGARRPNAAVRFNPRQIIKCADEIDARIDEAEEAIKDLDPSLDRFR